MTDENLLTRVARVLDTVKHATVATVSAEGNPWNTPVFFVREGRSLFWISRTDAQHTLNLRINDRAFIVIYDSGRPDESGAAVYIEARVTELDDQEIIQSALNAIYQRREERAPHASNFSSSSVHRIFHASIINTWTNVLHESDECPWDERVPISLRD